MRDRVAHQPAGFRRHHHRRHLQGALADRTVLQGAETELDREELRRHQRERASHPDLDSPDRNAPVEMAASPLQGELVLVQLGIPAPLEPVYLPRIDQVATQSHGNAAAASCYRTTHLGYELIWTGTTARKRRPHPEISRIRPISRLISGELTAL